MVGRAIGGDAGRRLNTLTECGETEPKVTGSIGSWSDVLQFGFEFCSALSGNLGSLRGGLHLFLNELGLTSNVIEAVLQIHKIRSGQA